MLWSEGVGCRRVNNWLDLGLKKKTVMVCTLPEDQFQAWFPQGSGPVSVSDLLGEVDAPYQGGVVMTQTLKSAYIRDTCISRQLPLGCGGRALACGKWLKAT